MVIEIKDIRLYKILLEDIDETIQNLESNEDKLFTLNKELKALNRKHAGLLFCLFSLLYTMLSFIALRMCFVLMPKDFPYYYLAPIPGIIIEYILRNKFIKNEKKHTEKALKGQINKTQEDINENISEIRAIASIISEAKKKLTNITDVMSENVYALNYISRNDDEYNKVSFEVRYNEFISKINLINEENYPELMELKNEILKWNDITTYRNIVINSLKTKETEENEKNDNPMSDTKEN